MHIHIEKSVSFTANGAYLLLVEGVCVKNLFIILYLLFISLTYIIYSIINEQQQRIIMPKKKKRN